MPRKLSAWQALAAMGSAFAIVGLAVVYSPARAGARALHLLVVPGVAVAMVALAFPRRSIGRVERCVYSLGIGLAVLALSGFALDATPWGLPHEQAQPLRAGVGLPLRFDGPQWGWWLVGLGGAMVTGVVIARAHRMIRPMRLAQSGLWLLAGIIFVLALATATRGALHAPMAGFTQLWTVRAESTSSDAILIGLNSNETQETTYALRAYVDGQLFAVWPTITLAPSEQRELTVTRPKVTEGPGIVEVQLFRSDDPNTVYRRAILRP